MLPWEGGILVNEWVMIKFASGYCGLTKKAGTRCAFEGLVLKLD
jgi:hypothetical protein